MRPKKTSRPDLEYSIFCLLASKEAVSNDTYRYYERDAHNKPCGTIEIPFLPGACWQNDSHALPFWQDGVFDLAGVIKFQIQALCPEAVNSLSSPSYFEGSQFRRNLNLSLQDTKRGDGWGWGWIMWVNSPIKLYGHTTSRAVRTTPMSHRTSAWMRGSWITTSQGGLEKPQLRSHSRCCWLAYFQEIIDWYLVADDCMMKKGWIRTTAGVSSWVELGQLLEVLSACGCSPLGPWPRLRPLAGAVALDWLSKSF